MYTRSGLRYDDCTPPEAKSWRAADAGQRRDLGRTVTGRSTVYNLHVPSPDDVCLSAWTNPFASTTNRARVIIYHEGLLVVASRVCDRCRESSLYPIDLT